jgi:hypothetical protein
MKKYAGTEGDEQYAVTESELAALSSTIPESPVCYTRTSIFFAEIPEYPV